MDFDDDSDLYTALISVWVEVLRPCPKGNGWLRRALNWSVLEFEFEGFGLESVLITIHAICTYTTEMQHLSYLQVWPGLLVAEVDHKYCFLTQKISVLMYFPPFDLSTPFFPFFNILSLLSSSSLVFFLASIMLSSWYPVSSIDLFSVEFPKDQRC